MVVDPRDEDHRVPTLFSRPVIGRVPIIRVDLDSQAWRLGEREQLSENYWSFFIRFDNEDRSFRIRCSISQEGQEISVRLPWKPRPDYRITEHDIIHLEGNDWEYNSFLSAIVCTMDRCWDVRAMFGLSAASLFVGPFRSAQSTVRRWAEVVGDLSEPLHQAVSRETPGSTGKVVAVRCFLRAMAQGGGKIAASRVLADRFGWSYQKGYRAATAIMNYRPQLFLPPESGGAYKLSPLGFETLDRLERQADGRKA